MEGERRAAADREQQIRAEAQAELERVRSEADAAFQQARSEADAALQAARSDAAAALAALRESHVQQLASEQARAAQNTSRADDLEQRLRAVIAQHEQQVAATEALEREKQTMHARLSELEEKAAVERSVYEKTVTEQAHELVRRAQEMAVKAQQEAATERAEFFTKLEQQQERAVILETELRAQLRELQTKVCTRRDLFALLAVSLYCVYSWMLNVWLPRSCSRSCEVTQRRPNESSQRRLLT